MTNKQINQDKIIKYLALLNARVLKNDKDKKWNNVRLINYALHDLLKIMSIEYLNSEYGNELSKWTSIYDKKLEKNDKFCPKEFELDFLHIVD